MSDRSSWLPLCGSLALAAIVFLAGRQGGGSRPGVAVAQDATRAADPGMQIRGEDPFADELNPFGGAKGKPAQAPNAKPAAKPAEKPAPKPAPPPVRPGAAGAGGAAPSGKPLARPTLPVPFPDADGDDDADADDRRPRRKRPLWSREDSDSGRFRDDLDEGDQFGEMDSRRPRGPSSEEAERLLVKAEEYEKAGKLEQARDTLREVVKLDSSLAVGHLALGVVLRRLGDYRGSVDSLTKGITIEPEEPELYLRRGISWFHLGLYGIALEDFEEAAGLSYDDPRPEMWRGLTLVELDRPLEAINAYASSIRRDRTYMLAYLNRGLVYLATNEPSKAEFDFSMAIRQKPDDVRAWFNRGVAQARQRRYREAAESYEHALRIKPGDSATRQNLDAVRRMIGRDTRRP